MQENIYSVYVKKCPSHNVLQVISDKWSIILIHLLSQKTCRFGELKRQADGISQKMLAQTLRELEKYGFVLRETYPVLPLKVEYSLTSLGQELSHLLRALTEWTEGNMAKILQAEKNYFLPTSNTIDKPNSSASLPISE